MINIKTLAPNLSVAPQISVDDIPEISKLGFTTIINNRPDHESDDQPLSAELAQAAKQHGLAFYEVPVASECGDTQVKAFTDILQTTDGKTLAFCRSGTRSAMLWALYAASYERTDAILRAAEQAGYNLETLKPKLEHIAALKTA